MPLSFLLRGFGITAWCCLFFYFPANAAEVAIEAPATVHSSETFFVTVSGPEKRGDMLRFADADGNVLGGSYAYVGNTKDGRLRLTAPFEPGRYQVVYLSEREVVAAVPLQVEAVNAVVEAPAAVDAGSTFSVAFSGPRNGGDYLQVMDASQRPMRGLYAYVGNARDGRVNLRAPAEPGEYHVAYLTAKQVIGSAPLTVRGVSATLWMDAEVPEGAHFEVRWEGPDNSGDMVRVVREDGTATGSYAYVGNYAGRPVSLRAPEETGSFRVVYRSGEKILGKVTFTVVPVSAALKAPDSVPGDEQFAVTWEGPGNRGDTIKLTRKGKSDDLAYAFVDADRGREVVLWAPAEPGEYILRYYTHGGRVLADRPLAVAPPQREPGTLRVIAEAKLKLEPDDAVELILDASGSMLQRQDGERRIDIAKRTLQRLIDEVIPPGTLFAMRVFGHLQVDSCRTDLELPLAPLQRPIASAKLAGIMAKNLARTPIAHSLSLAGSDLADATGERIIVLVTDGEETCEGDPAAALAALRSGGDRVRVNIVGYAIDDAGLQETFRRWARLGGGEYFDAANEQELSAALGRSVAPAYTVFDTDGREVASGIAGGKAVRLAPGEYTVEVLAERRSATVHSGTVTEVALH